MADALPSQADGVSYIHVLRENTRKWLLETDLECANAAIPWAGVTMFGVALFSLRHSLFHIGELSSLLNESKQGEVEDHYVKAIGTP